jgi:hypothetical protein
MDSLDDNNHEIDRFNRWILILETNIIELGNNIGTCLFFFTHILFKKTYSLNGPTQQ